MSRLPRHRNDGLVEQPLQAASAKAVRKAEQRDQIFQHMQDIFTDQLEADVIHMVLAECDWDEGESMDMLLSLCHDCGPKRREATGPDLASIACSLIDETKNTVQCSLINETKDTVQCDQEVARADLDTCMTVGQEAINITNHEEQKGEMIKRQRGGTISPCYHKTNSAADDLSMNLISPSLSEDVKNITMQSYMSVYLDSVCSNVVCSLPDTSVLEDEDNVNSLPEALLRDSSYVSDKNAECNENVSGENELVDPPVDVIDREVNTGDGNHSRCISDKPDTNMFSTNSHSSSDTVCISGPDKSTVCCTSRSSPLEDLKESENLRVCVDKVEDDRNCVSPLICTNISEKILGLDQTFESLMESPGSKMDILSSVKDDKRTDSYSLENNIVENECSSTINFDNCDQSSKLLESLSITKETISEHSVDADNVHDKTESKLGSPKDSSVALAHLSPEAPEFIPSFTKPSQTYPLEGSPVFFTPQGPKSQPYRTISPAYPSHRAGFLPRRHRFPLTQIMLKPIPVSTDESQTGAKYYKFSEAVYTFTGNNSSVSDTTTINNSHTLYSQAVIKNGNEPVLTSPKVVSRELVTVDPDENITWVKRYLDRGQLLMIILRGLPGSGKSTLARELNLDGAILNTDEYFVKDGFYEYDINKLSDAHDWNKARALKAMQKKTSPVIIDNTNLQMWEMIPYVKLALAYKYVIEIVEPNTPWKEKPAELAKRNSHDVSKESIKKMKQRYERHITVKKLIASVKATDLKEKQKEIVNMSSQKLQTNDLSFSCSKSSKESDNQSHQNVPMMSSSYNTLLKTQNRVRENLSTKSKAFSASVSKSKAAHGRPKMIPNRKDFQSRKKLTDADGNNSDTVDVKNPLIVQNRKDIPGVSEDSNTGQDDNNLNVCKKPSFGHSQKNCVISTLEDLLSQGHIQNMTEEDWARRKEELEVLLQLSPVEPNEKNEISQWLEYKMKQLRVVHDSSENIIRENNVIDNSPMVSEVRHLGAEGDDFTIFKPLGKEDHKVGGQMLNTEDNFSHVSSSVNMKNDIQLNTFGLNNTTEEDSELINRTTDIDRPLLGSLPQDAFLSLAKDTTVDIINTDINHFSYSLNIDIRKTNSKTRLSHVNLNSDVNDVKITKQKDINPPLLDVSTVMDFSENKESMLSKKQEVSDKEINFVASISGNITDYECGSLNKSDTNLNIPDTEKCWNDVAFSPVVKECSSVWDDNSCVNSSKPKREPRKKNRQNLGMELVKNNEICHVNLNSENLTSENSSVCENCRISDEEIVDWVLDEQKPKPQRERKISERRSQSSDNISPEKFLTRGVDGHIEIETSIEQQNIAAVENGMSEVGGKDSCNDDEVDAKEGFGVIGCQENNADNQKNRYSSKLHFEESSENQNGSDERLISSDVQNVSESCDSCKHNTIHLSTSSRNCNVMHETNASSNEPASAYANLTNPDELTGRSDQTSQADDNTELLNADVQLLKEMAAVGPTKKSKRSKHKHPMTPFLGNSSKQKFESSNWSTFHPIQNACSNVVHFESKSKKTVNKRSHWTLTTAKDFNVLDGLNRDCNVSSIKNADQYTILRGKDRSLNQKCYEKSNEPEDHISVKLHLDKGTMTDDYQNSLESDIDFLKHSFPDMSENQLWEVLAMCQNDVEWSLNLLLDWGVHVLLTPVDKQEIAEEMFKLKQSVCHDKFGSLSVVSSPDHPLASPSSLFDLCSELITSKRLATMEQVQQGLIKNGYMCLKSMERCAMEQMMTFSSDRSTSQVEFNDFQDLPLQPASSRSLSNSSSCSYLLATADTNKKDTDTSETNLADVGAPEIALANIGTPEVGLAATSTIKEREIADISILERDISDVGTVERRLSGEVTNTESAVPGVEKAESFQMEGYIVLPVHEKLVQALESLFGSTECRLEADDEFEVLLDLNTAKLIHSCLRRKKHSKSVLKQLREDEALARRLQQEEKYGNVNRRSPMSDLTELEPLHNKEGVNSVSHNKKEEPVKLKDIMKEEKDKHVLRIEQQKVLEEFGDRIAIATKLKRQKLYNLFPGMDENFLEEIFQANGYSLEDTVCVIQNCLGSKEKVRSLMTEEAMARVDDRLMEQAKQMDSFPKTPTPSSDFQEVCDDTATQLSYSELRAEGTLHHQLRNDCFRKAQHAYQRNMNDVAYFYSQQGHLHTKKLKEAHMRASQKLLESRNDLLEKQSTLDLHGFHVGEAISTLQRVLEQREIEFQLRPECHKQSLVIVTGRGRHSHGGVAKVRPAVANFLNTAGYRYTEEHIGIFKVQLRYRSTVS